MVHRLLLSALLPLSVLACLTPAGRPCATLTYAETRWENKSWGFHNVDRYESTGVHVYRADGTRAVHGKQSMWTNYFMPGPKQSGGFIEFPDQTAGFNHNRKIVAVRPVRDRRTIPVASFFAHDCSVPGRPALKKGPRIAGYDTNEITFRGPANHVSQEYRAPALGCLSLKEVMWEYNSFGLPTRFRQWEVKSITLGPPEAKHFEIPANYQILR
ncbi:MAG: hypothetical protein JNL98_41660 [Bryobacterales bacterium]|nr:hypothetical protein [Bryobacterales bacterium]